MRLETIATDLQKQIGGGRVMISEMGHTQKCTPSIACAQNVKASVKDKRSLIGHKWEALFGNENDVMRCKCRMPASQQATSTQH